MRTYEPDAIAMPTAGWSSSHAAVAGYPSLSLPVDFDAQQFAVGLCLIAGYLTEPRLLALAYDFEQELDARTLPTYAGEPYDWPDAGLCSASAPVPADAR